MDKPYITQECEPTTMDFPYMDIESTSSSNSVGVAITQPRVAGEARYPGYIDNTLLPIPIHFPAAGNAYG